MNEELINIYKNYNGILKKEELVDLPNNYDIYSCLHCRYIFDPRPITDSEWIITGGINKSCPICKTENIELLCKVDLYSYYLKDNNLVDCRKEELIPGVEICPVCNRAICPQCFNHSTVALSRVTGYLQDINGWNEGKKQEILDRKRYSISD